MTAGHGESANKLSGPLFVGWLVYVCFVIYGSLVPLDFRPLPLDEAVKRFAAIPYLDLGIDSRADWVANLLLFIPLTFLWVGLIWHRRSLLLRLAASVTVWFLAVSLSIGIEFTQLFFPPRTVSQNDILAESMGALFGIFAWWSFGPRLVRWFDQWRGEPSSWNSSRRWLYLYFGGLFAYNLLPLDLTISPVEVFHKMREGRLVLIPFAGLPSSLAYAAYELITDIALWVPVGLLWQRISGSVWLATRNTVLVAVLLEFLQLWVFSRVSDVTDILTAGLGGWLGAMAALRLAGVRPGFDERKPESTASALVWPVATLLWLGILAVVFWYPFDFRTDTQFLRDRVALLKAVPFTAYYYGTEFRAATEVLHKVLFFAPLGIFAGLGMQGVFRSRAVVWGLGVLFASGVAGVIEGGQLALPGKNADLTDWALESFGAIFGLWLALKCAKSARSGRDRRNA